MESNRKIYITNPYTQEVVGTVPRASREQTADIFEIASTYIPQLTRHQRQKILMNCSELLNSKKEQISNLITAESGLCKKDSLHEVGRAVNVFSLTAHLCILDDSEIFSCDVSPPEKKRKIFTQREPLKSISAITPFNHPLNMMSHKVAPAIATNNCLVGKPSELTPLTALLLAEILYESGLPPEMFSIVTGYPEEIGEEMITNKHVELITFTGSVPVGKYIAEHAGYRRTVLELGGNSPLIIMEDADLDKAAVLAVQGATKFSGQRCTAVKRVVVVEAIANEFVSLMTKKASRLRCGDPMNLETDVGTVISESAAVLIEDRVNNAINEGAILLYGNRRDGAVYSPTVLDHVPFDCELVQNETFGPTIPVIRVRDIDQAISVSNSTPYGLSSGICTNNLNYIIQFINELKTGTVNVWEVPGYRTEISPFGGIKDSGLGYKEGIRETMKSYTNIKTFSLPWA